MAPDRERKDGETRRRVDEIGAALDAWRERVDVRLRRVVRLTVAAIVVTLAAVASGYLILQGQRWDQTRDGCERSNRITEATVGLLEDLQVRPAVIEVTKRRYPHVPPLVTPPRGYSGPASCVQFADERVRGPKL
jgi:hypothetical protein